MSSVKTIGSAVLLSLLFASGPTWAQTESSPTDQKQEQQIKQDVSAVSEQQQKLADYQQQAQWYERFAQKRLLNAKEERAEVELRLKQLESMQAKNAVKNPKSTISQEIETLKNWLTEEESKRKQIENTRARWHAAIEGLQSQVSQTKYETDADKAALEHQQKLEKENAARQADNPKPAPPQIQQNTILMPGWETEQGNIPTLLGPQK